MNRLRVHGLYYSLFWHSGQPGGIHAFSLGLGGDGTVTMSAGQGFGPKLQYGGGVVDRFRLPDPRLAATGRIHRRLHRCPVRHLGRVSLPRIFRRRHGDHGPGRRDRRLLAGLGLMRAGGGIGIGGGAPQLLVHHPRLLLPGAARGRRSLIGTPAGLPRFDFQLSVACCYAAPRRDLNYSACHRDWHRRAVQIREGQMRAMHPHCHVSPSLAAALASCSMFDYSGMVRQQVRARVRGDDSTYGP